VLTVTAADRDAQIARAAAGDPEAVEREALLAQWEADWPAELQPYDVFPDDDNLPATSTMARAVATGQPLTADQASTTGHRWLALRALFSAARRNARELRLPAKAAEGHAHRLSAAWSLLMRVTGAGRRTPAVDSPAASPGQLVTTTPHITRGPNARRPLVETVEGRAGSRAPSGRPIAT